MSKTRSNLWTGEDTRWLRKGHPHKLKNKVEPTTCHACGGTGVIEHPLTGEDHECVVCEGMGEIG